MSEVRIKFKGIEQVKDHYVGDGLDVKEGDTVSVSVKKAHQLLRDFPKEWELVDMERKDLQKMFLQYKDRMIGEADLNKGMVISVGGKTYNYPPGTTFMVTPVEPKKSFGSGHRCEEEGCGILTKENEDYCKRHTK